MKNKDNSIIDANDETPDTSNGKNKKKREIKDKTYNCCGKNNDNSYGRSNVTDQKVIYENRNNNNETVTLIL